MITVKKIQTKFGLSKETAFYKNVFALTLPFVAINALSIILNFCDTIMLGKMAESSEAPISAAGIATQPFLLYTFFIFGAVSGMSVLASQYWGKKDVATINVIAGITSAFLIAVGIIIVAAVSVFAKPIMSLLSSDSEVIGLSVQYLHILLISFLPYAVSSVLSGVLRTVENVNVPLAAIVTGILTNIFFNYCLIFGKLSFPEMGIRGAAIATVIARFVEMGFLLVYVIFFDTRVRLKLSKMMKFNRLLIMDFLKYSIPVIINEAAWGFGITVHTAVIGGIGKEQYTAYTIANLVERVAQLSMIGFSNSAAIIIGRSVGEGKKEDELWSYAKTFYLLSTIFVTVMSAIVFITKRYIINIYNIADITKSYADQLLTVICVFVFLKNTNCLAIVGIFRGGGDTKTGAIVDTMTMYLFAIPLGLLARFVFNLPLVFVYMFLVSDELAKLPIVMYRLKSKRWIRKLTREFN